MIGYALALVIGCIMGLLGAGGSLIFPIMVYLLTKDATLATAYALFLVGLTSSIGVVKKIRDKEVNFQIGFLVAIPTMLGTLFDRLYLIHAIPDPLFEIGDFVLGKTPFLLSFFAVVLALSSLSMLGVLNKGLRTRNEQNGTKTYNSSLIIGLSFAIGIISGLVGAGGGVLVVPMLVLMIGMEIRSAIGTSLFVIAFKSLLSFAFGDAIRMGGEIEWTFLFALVGCMITGIIFGTSLSKFVEGAKLKRGFGVLLLLMSGFIIVKEAILGLG
ncbi:MAG: sulfite exporter TauE/SafE family protein [Bacteroidetes bacterium]|nr:sulfite exporter TauE/SafE family protein [Bacteroidota bacterium]